MNNKHDSLLLKAFWWFNILFRDEAIVIIKAYEASQCFYLPCPPWLL